MTFFGTAPCPCLLCCSGRGRWFIYYRLLCHRSWRWDWIMVFSYAATHRPYYRLLVWWCDHYALWLSGVIFFYWTSHHRGSILLHICPAKHLSALSIRGYISFQVYLAAVISFEGALVGYIFSWFVQLASDTACLDLGSCRCAFFHCANAPCPARLLTRCKQL